MKIFTKMFELCTEDKSEINNIVWLRKLIFDGDNYMF